MSSEETCKCGNEKYPFDLVCDSCNKANIVVKRNYFGCVKSAVKCLGLSFTDTSQDLSFYNDLSVKVHRDDESALRELIDEIQGSIYE